MYRDQVSLWRRLRRYRQIMLVSADAAIAPDPSSATDIRLTMREALRRLPPAQRAVLVLRYYEDLSEGQIAEALGCSVGTVRSRTHRAIGRLRHLLPDVHFSGVMR